VEWGGVEWSGVEWTEEALVVEKYYRRSDLNDLSATKLNPKQAITLFLSIEMKTGSEAMKFFLVVLKTVAIAIALAGCCVPIMTHGVLHVVKQRVTYGY